MTADNRPPTVSVVVSCYNYAAFLPAAVESALRQTYPSVEVIIVDDGSTDDTPAVAARLAADPRVRYVRQEHRGQAAAKNTGIGLATGAFVAFLDADDRWRSQKLERQIPLFADPGVGVVYSRMRPISADGKPLDSRDTAAARQPHRGRVCEPLFIDNFVPFSSAVVRREVFERVGRMDRRLSMGIDWDLWLRASLHFSFDYVDDELLDYRVGHAGQMSKRQEERHGWAEAIMTRFLKENPRAISPAVVRRAWRHTFNSRGYYYRSRDLAKSTLFYLRSLKVSPLQIDALRGLAGNAWTAVRGSGGMGEAA
jgi:glycosyltransferase involved in cell wall biosynthesis